jgi:hypothetical protein
MRVTCSALLLLGIFVRPAMAQAPAPSRYEVAAGYLFMHDQDISENFPRGWVVSGAGNVTRWLGVVGEAGISDKTLDLLGEPPKLRVYTFMGGPRATARLSSRVAPFGQVLFGAARASSSVLDVGDSVTDFGYQPGGGVDVHLSSAVGVRLQADYRIVRSEGRNSKESRVIAAAVVGFGR